MKTTLIILAISATLFSCKKDKNNSCATTKESLAGSYKLTSFKVSGVEIISQFDDCERDDILTLAANNTYTYLDAGITCDGDDSGSWTVTGNTISIGAIEGGTGTIDSYNCKDLVISGSASGVVYTSTLTKQ